LFSINRLDMALPIFPFSMIDICLAHPPIKGMRGLAPPKHPRWSMWRLILLRPQEWEIRGGQSAGPAVNAVRVAWVRKDISGRGEAILFKPG